MAIRREAKYVMNLGTFEVPDSITTHFVGGSPITIASGSFTYGEKGTNDWLVEMSNSVQGADAFETIGIAWFGETGPNEQFLPKDHVTLLGFPLFVVLYKEAYEPTAPFDATQTYNVGDLLRPKTVSVSGNNYAVWTNEAYPVTGINTYYGKVLSVEGTGANAILTVYFQPIVRQDS